MLALKGTPKEIGNQIQSILTLKDTPKKIEKPNKVNPSLKGHP